MTNKRLTIVTIDYPPERGGVARYLGSIAASADGEVDVVVPLGSCSDGPGNVSAKPMFRAMWPRWWPTVRVCRSLKEKASALLISHVIPIGTAALISKWLGGPPYAVLLHGLDIKRTDHTLWRSFLFRMVVRNASHVFVNSQATGRELNQRLRNSSYTVVTPGVTEYPLPDRTVSRSELGIAPDERVILAVARLVERKGYDKLLEAAKYLPTNEHIRIVIIGSGPEEHHIRSFIPTVPHRVQMCANATDEEVAAWYAASDVFCLPVREMEDDIEGFGIVFLEAAYASLPVIAGKTGGAVEAVEDGVTGVLVDSEDPVAIARELVLMLENSERRKSFGEKGRCRAIRDFAWKDRWETLKRIMNKV